MQKKELAPVDIRIISPKEISETSLIAKVNPGISLGAKIDTVLGVAGDVLEAIENTNFYKVEVPDGYTLKDLVPSKKDAESVRAIVKDSTGKINGDVSLKLNGISPTQIASMGLAAAAIVVGQAYMTEINNSLHSIDSKLDVIRSMIAGEQRAKVKNAISIASTYVNLYDEYREKPPEAFQAARNEIEARYNDIGDVIDWISEQLKDLENRIVEARASEKELSVLLEEFYSYEDQFALCLQALSVLGMTRMYYDGCIDERSALIERQRIESKSHNFQEKRLRVSGIIESRIGELKCAPLSLPSKGEGKSLIRSLTSQTPRAAAKDKLLESKRAMQSNLRTSALTLKGCIDNCTAGVDNIVSANQAARTLLTDGTDFWILEPGLEPCPCRENE